MTTLVPDIRTARSAVERLLDDLGVREFAYTVEAKESGWLVRVDCAMESGWQETTLPVDSATLCASLDDSAVRDKLREAWAPHFQACLRRGAGGEKS